MFSIRPGWLIGLKINDIKEIDNSNICHYPILNGCHWKYKKHCIQSPSIFQYEKLITKHKIWEVM